MRQYRGVASDAACPVVERKGWMMGRLDDGSCYEKKGVRSGVRRGVVCDKMVRNERMRNDNV